MVDAEECFGYAKRGNIAFCKILKRKDCKYCSFYQSKAEYREGLRKYPPDMSKFEE